MKKLPATSASSSATNIVPDLVEIAMDCRSRNPEKLEKLTADIVAAYKKGGEKAGVPVDVEVKPSYKPYCLAKDSKVILLEEDLYMTCQWALDILCLAAKE